MQTKLALVTFLSSDLFQEAEVVVHFLVASADPRYRQVQTIVSTVQWLLSDIEIS